MKPHLIIKLREPLAHPIKYWEDIIDDKSGVPTSLHTALDQLISQEYRLPFWVTHNYRPRDVSWSNDEVKRGFDRVYRLILKHNSVVPDRLIEQIRLVPDVEYAYSGQVVAAPIPHSDYAQSSSLTQPYRVDGTYLREAHEFSKGNPDVKIAVLDTGFEVDHPELEHAMLPGKDFVNITGNVTQFLGDYLGIDDEPDDSVGHGTHVAGIIAGRGKRMPLGVVPRCRILPVKVLGALKKDTGVVGAGLIDNINNGIKWAVDQGVDIVNMSLGIKHSGGGLPHEEVIRYALDRDVTVIAASGNDGTQDRYYPGALPGVIAVGAADGEGNMANFSTFGGHVSLIAPGVNIYSTYLNMGYAVSSGTSQAAPFVAGAVGLLHSVAKERGKRLSSNQIKYLLKNTSDKISGQFKDIKAGFGHINLLDALRLMQYKL